MRFKLITLLFLLLFSTSCGSPEPDEKPATKPPVKTVEIPDTEKCDGLDNDDDGKIDEGCVCKDGQTQRCGRRKGICRQGTQTCKNKRWGVCKGEIKATIEVCDRVDNDCDGKVDEGCDCVHGETRKCGYNLPGECKEGIQTCVGASWGDCIGGVLPSQELCDGKDNDCDGFVDENCTCKPGLTIKCNPRNDPCGTGYRQCMDGVWGTCTGGTFPVEEICDGFDNDCDGKVDEATKVCYTQCGKGVRQCHDGQWKSCQGKLPAVEKCDGMDTDCDGRFDEGCPAPKTCSFPGRKIQLVDKYPANNRVHGAKFSSDGRYLTYLECSELYQYTITLYL